MYMATPSIQDLINGEEAVTTPEVPPVAPGVQVAEESQRPMPTPSSELFVDNIDATPIGEVSTA